jgi:hypothetical protein
MEDRAAPHRARRAVAAVLVVVFALSTLTSGVGIWLHRSTLDEDVWAERVVPLGADPAVQAALAAWTTDQVMAAVDVRALLEDGLPPRAGVLAGPLSSAVTGWIGDRVDRFYASDEFERLWTVAATQAHDRAVDVLRGDLPNATASRDGVTIDLVPVIDAILRDVADRAPSLVGRDIALPRLSIDDAPGLLRQRIGRSVGTDPGPDFGIITIDDGGKLAGAQQAVRWFDRLVVVSIALMLLSAAGAVSLSPRRRRTVLQLLGATALVAIATRRVTFVLQGQILDLVRVDVNRPAASVVVHSLTDPFTDAAATALWVVAAVTVAVAMTGPYRWARQVRGTVVDVTRSLVGAVTGASRNTATTTWMAANADALRVGGYALGALVLWVAELTWATLLLLAVAVAAWQVLLARLTDGATPAPASPSHS